MDSDSAASRTSSDQRSGSSGRRPWAPEQQADEVVLLEDSGESGSDPDASAEDSDQPAELMSPSTCKHQLVFDILSKLAAKGNPPKWAQLMTPVWAEVAPGSFKCQLQCKDCSGKHSAINPHCSYEQHRTRCKVLAWQDVLPECCGNQQCLSPLRAG